MLLPALEAFKVGEPGAVRVLVIDGVSTVDHTRQGYGAKLEPSGKHSFHDESELRFMD